MSQAQYDVAIVGYGPVGQLLCGLLGRQGIKVAAFEQWPVAYNLPRACVVDHEIMRILQADGVAERFEAVAVNTMGDYTWTNARGEVLLKLQRPAEGLCGWGARYMMYQPDLEELLDKQANSLGSVSLHRGCRAAGLQQHADGVVLDIERGSATKGEGWVGTGDRETVSARYVVGADGANSFVREAAGLGWCDLGFRADWLVIDFRPHDPEMELDVPLTGQICDPLRPVSLFRRLGRYHVRWEMMLRPGETAAQITQPQSVWSLLSRWVKPHDGVVVRSAVYTFRSGVAERWHDRRVLLAGDAAHVMPPFLGQGMCSGMRDAMGVAWRLSAILRGEATDAVLASYTPERRTHVEGVIARSVALGKIVCITDPAAAAQRDAQFLSGMAPPLPEFPSLREGILNRGLDGLPTRHAGELCLQAAVSLHGVTRRFDDIVGFGWVVLTYGVSLGAVLSSEQRAYLQKIGARLVQIQHQGELAADNAVIDVEGLYGPFFRSLDAVAIIMRPDFYIFGSAPTLDAWPGLIADLADQLPVPRDRVEAIAASNPPSFV